MVSKLSIWGLKCCFRYTLQVCKYDFFFIKDIYPIMSLFQSDKPEKLWDIHCVDLDFLKTAVQIWATKR